MRRLLILAALLVPSYLQAQPSAAPIGAVELDRVGNYRTREDRREAGLGTQLTDWLTFSGLIEVESLREVTKFDVALSDHYDFSTDPAVQAAFDLEFLELFEAELILEYSEDSSDPIMDEFVVATDVGDWGFSAGRFYSSFGLYYSHFINGPLLEFAETRRDMFQVDYDMFGEVEFFAFAFDGKTKKLGESNNDIGWGAGVDAFFMDGRLNVGGGFISNLGESDEEYLREENYVFQQKVGAWNAYAVYEADTWDVSFEMLQATDRFLEFEADEDKPESWNLEAAYFPGNNFEVAFRYERSKELLDSPEEVYGIAFTWRFLNNVSMTAEYLKQSYKKGFVEEDDEIFVNGGNAIALWFAFEF